MRGVPTGERAPDVLADDGVTRELGQGSRSRIFSKVCADELLASGRTEPTEQRDGRAVRARDDRILQHRRAGRERADAQSPDMHPGPGRELEILGEPAVEHDALLAIVL